MDPSDIPLCDSRTGVPQFVAGDTPKVYGDGEFFSHGEGCFKEKPPWVRIVERCGGLMGLL